MRIPEEKIRLKNGKELTLRSAEEKDALTMLDYLKKTSEETPFLIRYPEEVTLDLETEKKFLNGVIESEDSVWFTVFDEEKAVGNCSINCLSNRMKLKHRCSMGIALEQAYCGCGLGTMLIEKARNKARELGFEQMELGVFANNERAVALYRKMGFVECGRMPRAFRMKDGTYIDEINMVLFL